MPPRLRQVSNEHAFQIRNNNSFLNSNLFLYWFRLFGAKCDKCGSGFSRSDFVMRAKSKIYHIECFRCALCQRQLVPGDEFALRDDGNLFCKDDHDQTTVNNNNNNSSSQNNNNHSSTGTAGGLLHSVGSSGHHGSHHHHSHHHSLALLEAKSEHHNQSSNSSSGTVTFMPNIKSHSNSFRNCLIGKFRLNPPSKFTFLKFHFFFFSFFLINCRIQQRSSQSSQQQRFPFR